MREVFITTSQEQDYHKSLPSKTLIPVCVWWLHAKCLHLLFCHTAKHLQPSVNVDGYSPLVVFF